MGVWQCEGTAIGLPGNERRGSVTAAKSAPCDYGSQGLLRAVDAD